MLIGPQTKALNAHWPVGACGPSGGAGDPPPPPFRGGAGPGWLPVSPGELRPLRLRERHRGAPCGGRDAAGACSRARPVGAAIPPLRGAPLYALRRCARWRQRRPRGTTLAARPIVPSHTRGHAVKRGAREAGKRCSCDESARFVAHSIADAEPRWYPCLIGIRSRVGRATVLCHERNEVVSLSRERSSRGTTPAVSNPSPVPADSRTRIPVAQLAENFLEPANREVAFDADGVAVLDNWRVLPSALGEATLVLAVTHPTSEGADGTGRGGRDEPARCGAQSHATEGQVAPHAERRDWL
eukprot:1183230-Prorocentrum_minimum.AAC.2